MSVITYCNGKFVLLFQIFVICNFRHIRLFQVTSIRGSSLKSCHIFIMAEKLFLTFAECLEWMDNFRILNNI